MKKILIITATHGNEKIGIEVVKELIKQGYKKYFDFITANPRANKRNIRFIDADLNRSYPGNKNSLLYEKRRAFEIEKIVKNYELIIDLHEASEGINNFIIVPKKKIPKRFPIELIDLSKILLWPDPKGPLCSIIENGIELEFGMKNKKRKEVVKEAVEIVKKFINRLNSKKYSDTRQVIFYVYGKILLKDKPEIKLKDFKKVKIKEEEFYPLLVNQYLRLGILCYKMKKY